MSRGRGIVPLHLPQHGIFSVTVVVFSVFFKTEPFGGREPFIDFTWGLHLKA